MKIPRRVQRKGKEGINLGYKPEHQSMLDRENPTVVPETTIIGAYTGNEETEEQPICIECGSKLTYLSKSQKYLCTYSQCGKVFDAPATLDTPLLTKTNQSMQPYQSQYYDPNNPEGEPFFVSFNPDSGDVTMNKDYEVTYSSNDGRVKKVKVNGFPSDISKDAFND